MDGWAARTENDLQITVSDARSFSPLKGTGGLSGYEALSVRNVFKDYFNSEFGSVKWQKKRAQVGKRKTDILIQLHNN